MAKSLLATILLGIAVYLRWQGVAGDLYENPTSWRGFQEDDFPAVGVAAMSDPLVIVDPGVSWELIKAIEMDSQITGEISVTLWISRQTLYNMQHFNAKIHYPYPTQY